MPALVAFDRGLIAGSCLGETLGWPLLVLLIAIAVAAAAWLAIRVLGLAGAWILPWVLLGAGGLAALVAVAAVAFEPITSRIVRSGATVAISTCHGVREEVRSHDVADLSGRFVLQEKAKGPPTPLLRLAGPDGQAAQVWLGHPGADLDVLAGIAPGAIARYRSWRGR